MPVTHTQITLRLMLIHSPDSSAAFTTTVDAHSMHIFPALLVTIFVVSGQWVSWVIKYSCTKHVQIRPLLGNKGTYWGHYMVLTLSLDANPVGST